MRRVKSAPANIAAMAHSKKKNIAERDTKLLAVASKHTSCVPTVYSRNEKVSAFEMKTCMEDAIKEIANFASDDNFSETGQLIATTLLEHYMNKTEINFMQLLKNAFIRLMLSLITHNLALFVISVYQSHACSIHIN